MDTTVRAGRMTGSKLTRPNDTTAYTAGDVIADSASAATVFVIPNTAGGSKGFTEIASALCISSQNAATKPDLELWLFSAAPAVINDNAAFAPTDAELAFLLGVLVFPVASFRVANAGAAAAGNVVCLSTTGTTHITQSNTQGAVYGVVVVRNAYAPVVNEEFTFILKLVD